MEIATISIEGAREALLRTGNVPLDDDYIHIILTMVFESQRKPGAEHVPVFLTRESYDRLNEAPTTAVRAIEALIGERKPEGWGVFLAFNEDHRTVTVRFVPRR